MEAAGVLEVVPLSPLVPFRLSLTLPYEAIQPGTDLEVVREALIGWIAGEATLLADGTPQDRTDPSRDFPLHSG